MFGGIFTLNNEDLILELDRSVTAETAIRPSRTVGQTPWEGYQMQYVNSRRSHWCLVVIIFALLATDNAFAQIEEVIVTAQKREENLQDVPIAISVFSAEEITALSLKDVGEALNYVPNSVQVSGPSTTEDGFFFIRGVGQVDNSTNVDPGVGVYMDEVYLGRVQGASFDVLDVQSIEVLRGPQGTLFGRNTIGGAVSVHTREPGNEFATRGSVTLGSRDLIDLYLSTDVPLSEDWLMNASVFWQQQDGWADNAATGVDYGRTDNVGGRVKLQWQATDDLTFKLAGDYVKGKGTPIPTVLLGTGRFPAPQCTFGAPPGTLYFGSPLCVDFPLDYGQAIDTAPFDDTVLGSASTDQSTERGGVSLTAGYDLQTFFIKSITAYRKMDQQTYSDLDGSDYSFYDFGFGVDQHQFSQEIQAFGDAFDDRFRWLVGGFYFSEDILNSTLAGVGTNRAILTPPGVPFPFPYIPGPAQKFDGRALNFESNLDLDMSSLAFFSQLEFDFTDRLTGVAGGRWTHEEKTYTFNNASDNTDSIWTPVAFIPFPPGYAPVAPLGQKIYTLSCTPGSNSEILGGPCAFSADWNNFSPKLGLNFQLTEEFMAYVSWASGFKSGGFGGRATPGNTEEPYEPETIDTWEVGFKSEFADKRVRLNVAAFWSDYSDIQLLVLEVVNGTPQFNTRNAGSSDINGVELELWTNPVANLNFYLNAGWMENKYTSLSPGAAAFGIDITDSLPNAPEWTLATGAQYVINMDNASTLSLRVDYSWLDDFYFQAANQAGDLQQAYGLLDVRATYTPASGKYYIAAFGKNVTDEEYFLTKTDQRASLGVWLGAPAAGSEWGLEFGFKF